MFRRKRPLYRAAMANQPFWGQDGTLEWEPITTTLCPSGRSVYFITMPLTVLSVWKHFHMVVKTTCLDCGIKIQNDDIDSQKKKSTCHNPKVLTGTSHAFCGINTQEQQMFKCFSVNDVRGWGQWWSPEAECKPLCWRTNPNFFPTCKKCFSTEH